MIEPFRHNSWASVRLLEYCRELDPAMLDASARGTFGPIKETLAHVVSSEEGLLRMLAGVPNQGSMAFTSVDDLSERARRLAEHWERYLDPPPHPERLVERNLRGRRRMVRVGTVLAQVTYHGNEHRAQVCTILGAIGLEPPDLSGWAYGNWITEQRQQREMPSSGGL
jgi:uncharacterized damage-inducible protein DinB